MVNGSPYCTYAIRSLKVPPHYKYTGVLIVLKRFQDHLYITEAICAGIGEVHGRNHVLGTEVAKREKS